MVDDLDDIELISDYPKSKEEIAVEQILDCVRELRELPEKGHEYERDLLKEIIGYIIPKIKPKGKVTGLPKRETKDNNNTRSNNENDKV